MPAPAGLPSMAKSGGGVEMGNGLRLFGSRPLRIGHLSPALPFMHGALTSPPRESHGRFAEFGIATHRLAIDRA